MSVNANPHKGKRILVIEDEATLLRLVEMKLRAAGFDVTVAEDGRKGIDAIHERLPDLVLLDMMLPLMDGFQIIETLARERILPDLPVIITSNSGQPIEIDRAMKMGIRDYLIKADFTPEEVLQKVKEFFSASAAEVPKKEKKEHPLILVVEDDRVLVELLAKKAEQKNFRVDKALHVEEARKILKDHKVDAILLDVVLPDIDGFTYLQELKEDPELKDIPVIIVSNLGQQEEKEKGLRLGAADYMVKSNVLPSDILNRAEEVMKGNAGAGT